MHIRNNSRAVVTAAALLAAGGYGIVSWLYPDTFPSLPLLSPFVSILLLVGTPFFVVMALMQQHKRGGP